MRRRTWLLALSVGAAVAGCSTHGLAFRADERIDVVAPDDGSEVTLPLTVEWTADDLPSGTSYGVAVDEALPRPGEELDDEMRRTTSTEVVVDRFGSTSRPGGKGRHHITVFLVDADGRRRGESAWRVDVRLGDGS